MGHNGIGWLTRDLQLYEINICYKYSIYWDKTKGRGKGGFQINEKKKKTLDNQIGRDTKLSISMQSMDQIQFD